ncbi:MAG: transposase [Candidatus Cloacimonetes bacterium]|nr:transposase [Candidatus Cloacimonadota bacterium]
MILKEIFQLSDVELLGSIYFDDRFQYALRLTSFDKPPVSINTFTNFYAYEAAAGIDLIKEEVESLSNFIAEKLEIGDEKIHVGSFIVTSSSKNMSRIELVYTVNINLIKKLKQLDKKAIPENCLDYLKKGHKKDTIYKTRDKDIETKLEFLLKHFQMLNRASLKSSSKIEQTEEFKTPRRMLDEQTDNDDFDKLNPGELKIKEGQILNSDILQNPSDPDATYRYK